MRIVRVIMDIVFILSICENVHSSYQRFFTLSKPLDLTLQRLIFPAQSFILRLTFFGLCLTTRLRGVEAAAQT